MMIAAASMTTRTTRRMLTLGGDVVRFHPNPHRLYVLSSLSQDGQKAATATTALSSSPCYGSFPPAQLQPYRNYHATSRQEIVPLVVAVLGVVVIRYSYKAIKRMDDEWQDYQWELQQYEKKQGGTTSTDASLSTTFPHGTLGIDLGTVHLSLAHHHYSQAQQTQPEVAVNREGARYTFNGVLYPDSNTNSSEEDEILLGRLAFEKLYERRLAPNATQVVMPYDVLRKEDSNSNRSSTEVVRDAVESAVSHTLETMVGADASLDGVRPVVTIPPSTDDTRADHVREAFSQFLGSKDGNDGITFVPEPIAAVWGAEAILDLDISHGTPIFLVIDVGGYVTSLSILQKNKVLASVELEHVGGEVWPEVIVNHILNDKQNELLANDGMAMQRLYQAAHAAAMEFNTHIQAHIQIPYISMDMTTREAQHLDVTLSRSVVEQEVQDHLQKSVIALQEKEDKTIFSSHLPPPSDYTSFWTSAIAHLVEQVHLTPMNLEKVLVVGGGSKQPMIATSIEQSWLGLTGNTHALMIPELSKRSELVALGAASLSPHYHYTPEQGLVKAEASS